MRTKKIMKLPELQKLAERVQLKIKPEEANHLLTSLSRLEKLLVEFRKLNLPEEKSFLSQAKITLKNLRQLAKKIASYPAKQETIHHNAMISNKNFLVIRRK